MMFQKYFDKEQTPRVLYSAMDGIGGIWHGKTIEISVEKRWVTSFGWKWNTLMKPKKRSIQPKAGSAQRVTLPNQTFITGKPTTRGWNKDSGPKLNSMMNPGKLLPLWVNVDEAIICQLSESF
jgi:hypothetical protein